MDVKRKALALVAEIDEAELAVRLMSIGIGLVRTDKEKRTSSQIIADAKKTWPKECGAFPFDRMARTAIEYMGECVKHGSRPS